MTNLGKEERKRRIKDIQEAQSAELSGTMPLTPAQLDGLLNYLDANLKSCDHTPRITEIFLNAEKLDRESVLSWLGDRGGYCDCEVLANLEDIAESLRDRPPPPKLSPRLRSGPRDIATVMGWDMRTLPKPWRIGNLYAPNEPLRLQVGKRSEFSLTIMETPLPVADAEDDHSWVQLWYSLTELPERSPVEIKHGALELPGHLRSTLASTLDWSPVYCWIYPIEPTWFVQIQTEVSRQRGDLPQIAPLIKHLEMMRV